MLMANKKSRKNEKGMAVLEMIPVIIVVMVLLRYSYGFFGVIHAATVQSIAVRNYSFETFRHRSRLGYLRETTILPKILYKQGMRLHGIRDENSSASNDPEWDVARRDISFPPRKDDVQGATSYSSRLTDQANIKAGKRYSDGDGASPVWLSIRYGMCVDFQCRD